MENQRSKQELSEADENAMRRRSIGTDNFVCKSFPNQMENNHDLANWMKYDGTAQLGSMKIR